MQIQVLGQQTGEPPAEADDPLRRVADQLDRPVELLLRQRGEGVVQRPPADLLRRLDQVRGRRALTDHRPQGQRRGTACLHLVAQGLLELPVALEAEPGDEADDGRRAHPRPSGQPGRRLQARRGVVRHQRPSDLELRGRQGTLDPPQPLGHRRPQLLARAPVPARGRRLTALSWPTIHPTASPLGDHMTPHPAGAPAPPRGGGRNAVVPRLRNGTAAPPGRAPGRLRPASRTRAASGTPRSPRPARPSAAGHGPAATCPR